MVHLLWTSIIQNPYDVDRICRQPEVPGYLQKRVVKPMCTMNRDLSLKEKAGSW
jgi:hypothetical protein